MPECKFCTTCLDISGRSDDEIDDRELAYCFISENGFLVYGAPGDGYDGQEDASKINYCPMCGRYLG